MVKRIGIFLIIFYVSMTIVTAQDANTSAILINNHTIDVFCAGDVGPGELEKDNAVLWKNGEITKFNQPGSRTSSLFIDNGKVYVAGIFVENGATKPCYWCDEKTIVLPSKGEDTYTSSIYVVNKNVFISGHYKNDQGATQACYWINDKKIGLEQNQNESCYTRKIYVTGKDVYVVGFSVTKKDKVLHIDACYWRNGVKKVLDSGLSTLSIAYDIVFNGKDVFILGRLDDTKSECLCYWKNGKRSDLLQIENDYSQSNFQVFSIYESADYAILSTKDYKLFHHKISRASLYFMDNRIYILGKAGDNTYLWKNDNKIDLSPLGCEDIYKLISIEDKELLIGTNQNRICLIYNNEIIKSFSQFSEENFTPKWFIVKYDNTYVE